MPDRFFLFFFIFIPYFIQDTLTIRNPKTITTTKECFKGKHFFRCSSVGKAFVKIKKPEDVKLAQDNKTNDDGFLFSLLVGNLKGFFFSRLLLFKFNVFYVLKLSFISASVAERVVICIIRPLNDDIAAICSISWLSFSPFFHSFLNRCTLYIEWSRWLMFILKYMR